jgi:hypothetical protein
MRSTGALETPCALKLIEAAQAHCHTTTPSIPAAPKRAADTSTMCPPGTDRTGPQSKPRKDPRPQVLTIVPEERLNAIPQYLATTGGLELHVLHSRSPHPDALPLVLTHGWPGSVLEMVDLVGPLTERSGTAVHPRTRSTW